MLDTKPFDTPPDLLAMATYKVLQAPLRRLDRLDPGAVGDALSRTWT